MLRHNHIFQLLAAGVLLLGGAATGQERVTGYIFNIDDGKALSSADIYFEFYADPLSGTYAALAVSLAEVGEV